MIRTQVSLVIFFGIYLSTVLLTDISLVGYWTDIIFSFLLSIFTLILVFRKKGDSSSLSLALKATTIILSAIMLGIAVFSLSNPFYTDTFKMRSFYYQKVDGRIFHAYFKPVGAYSGGYGNFWITESPKYFPLIEKQVYYDRTVDYDFNDDNWDGQPTDNYEVVKFFIKEEVINKKK